MPNTHRSTDDVGLEINKELARISHLSQPDKKAQKRLAGLTRQLMDSGLDIDKIAALAGVHPLTVRSWLKNALAKAALVEPKKATPAVATSKIPRKTRSSLKSSVPDRTPQKTTKPSAPESSLPIPSASSLEPLSRKSNWVKIRVSGHVMEIDWLDLVHKLPVLDSRKDTAEVQLTAEENMDFNLAVVRDNDLGKVMDHFEKSIIKAAI